MAADSHDKELTAISQMLAALGGLDPAARERVLSYVLTRLDMKSTVGTSAAPVSFAPEVSVRPHTASPAAAVDIRSFAEIKAPRSANEMAAVVAYYVQYEAVEDERKKSITKADIEKYFHLAKFRKPKDAHFTLNNSKNAGYLDQLERGHYTLNPVGYNLVAHKLPHRRPKD